MSWWPNVAHDTDDTNGSSAGAQLHVPEFRYGRGAVRDQFDGLIRLLDGAPVERQAGPRQSRVSPGQDEFRGVVWGSGMAEAAQFVALVAGEVDEWRT